MIFLRNKRQNQIQSIMAERCRGKTVDGSKCKFQAAKGDKRCLAHKLKTLPRELVSLIFEKIEDLHTLKIYASIYSEAIPVYFKRKLEVGKLIGSELILQYNQLGIAQKLILQEATCRLNTNSQEEIDTAIFLLMFAVYANPFHKPFSNAKTYMYMQFASDFHKSLSRLFSSYELRLCLQLGYLSDDMIREIKAVLISLGNFPSSSLGQMNLLVLFLENAYWNIDYYFQNGEQKFAAAGAVANQIAKIKVDDKTLFSPKAIEKIFKFLYTE